MKASTPFASIILPTYKVQKYIERCLESCINQTFSNIEIIVVDDCGGDQSINIAKKFAEHDSRIKIIHSNSNRGTFLARNLGVSHASGQYVLFLDPDDQLTINAVELLKKEVDSAPTEILFYNVTEDESGRRKNIKTRLPQSANINEMVLQNIFIKLFHPPWGTPGKLYNAQLARTACAEFSDMQDRLTYSEDILFLFAAAKHAQSCRSIDQHLYIYFKNDESITKCDDLPSLKWKIEQSERSIELLLEISKSVTDMQSVYGLALQKVIGDIRSNYFKLTRFHPDFHASKNSYVYALRMAQIHKKNWANIFRIAINLATFGFIKS